MTSLILTYLVWALVSYVFWPWLRRAGLRAFPAWAAARTLSLSFAGIILLHILRWTGLEWSRYLYVIFILSGVCAGWAASIKLPGPRRKEMAAIFRFEASLACLAVILTVFSGFHYGMTALGERPMDMGLVTSLHSTRGMPPEDFWFAGKPLNTYYLGSWSLAAAARAAGARPWQAYFSGIVITWLQVFSSCTLAWRMLHVRGRWSHAFPFALIMMGHGGLFLLFVRGINPFGERGFLLLSRIIPHTINENPATALWVSELHAHIMALPIFIALILLWREALRSCRAGTCLASGSAAAVLAMTDAWLVPPAALATMMIAALHFRRDIMALIKPICLALAAALVTDAAWLADARGYPLRLLLVEQSATTAAHIVALFGPLLVVFSASGAGRWKSGTGKTGLALLVTGVILIALCEIVYVDNRFPPPGERQNTVFRFHWAAWAMLGLGICGLRPPRLKAWRNAAAWCAILVFAAAGHLPGIISLHARKVRFTTDLRQALDSNHEGLIEASEWLIANTSSGTVIAESGGIPYRGFALVSAISGRTAIFGEMDKLNNHAIEEKEIRARYDDLAALYYKGPASREIVERLKVDYLVAGPRESEAFPGMNREALTETYPIVFSGGATWILKVP